MSASRDVLRLINGVFLVAKEFAKPSQPKNGDLGTLISSSVKKAVVSATDLAGITSGNVRQFSPPRPKQSVVYFTDSPEIKTVNDSGSALDLENSNEKTENTVLKADLEENNGVSVRGFERLTESNAGNDHVTENLREIDSGKDPDYVKISENDQRNYNDLANSRERNGETVQPVKKRKPRERRVPSTPFTRALGFAGLGAGLAWGTIQESAKRLVFGGPKLQDGQSALSPFLSEQNAERLALALCRMRGAALKLGQMLSIQDETLIPAPILSALDIVRQGADVMPRSQLNHVLDTELGHDWSSKLKSFDYEPMAAASIGQVHRAFTRDNLEVAMKIQYPGVADSIESDIENVKRLLDYTNVIPKGLYLDSAMKVAKEELSRECEYELEAENQRRFRELLFNTEGFYVPIVIDDLSSRRVLTTELVPGIPIDKVASLNQETRDYVGKKLLELTLKELFVFRFMQTDPNWSNFLYDESTRMINLIDFGAAREYPQVFVDDYLKMVLACADRDRDRVIEMSRRLGFLTGMESEIMLDAHVQAGFIVGLPFSRSGGFDFRTTKITQSISDLGATMLKHRLTPPPDEAYSLHRKLSGAFLACIKLGSVVPCRDLFFQIYEQYQSSDDGNTILATSTP